MLFCYQLFPVCLFDEADCPERLEKQILSARSESLGTAVFSEQACLHFTGRRLQSRYHPVTGQRFYLATEVLDEFCCRLAAFQAQTERQQCEWAQLKTLANLFKLVSVGLDLALSSFDRKVQLVSIKSLCEMFRLALIDLSTWANDVFSVMGNSPCILFASDLRVEPRARGRVPVLTERGSLPL